MGPGINVFTVRELSKKVNQKAIDKKAKLTEITQKVSWLECFSGNSVC